MSVSFAFAIYVVIWWTVLFAILPIGVRTQGEDGTIVPGTPESAPTRPRLLRVVLLTTVVSGLVFAGLWAAVRYGLIDLEQLLGRRTTLWAQTKRARPMGLARGIADLVFRHRTRSLSARRAEFLPQTWAPEAPA